MRRRTTENYSRTLLSNKPEKKSGAISDDIPSYLSFKDVKEQSWERCIKSVAELVGEEAERLQSSFEFLDLSTGDRNAQEKMLAFDPENPSLTRALHHISQWLHQATGERVVILIDENDMPLHAAFTYGYYEDAITFFHNFLSAGLKGNIHLHIRVSSPESCASLGKASSLA